MFLCIDEDISLPRTNISSLQNYSEDPSEQNLQYPSCVLVKYDLSQPGSLLVCIFHSPFYKYALNVLFLSLLGIFSNGPTKVSQLLFYVLVPLLSFFIDLIALFDRLQQISLALHL